jgi:proline iminopeptidase
MQARINGSEIFYETLGSGPPVLVMHGGLGLDHTYFRPWLDPLAERFQLVFYDHRGCGRSERPKDWSAVTHETWVDDADALRAHLGHERVFVMGHSYGGFLALEYALRHPDRLRGLILSNTAPVFDYGQRAFQIAEARATPSQFRALVEGFSGPLPDDAAMADAFGIILPLYFGTYSPEIGAALARRIAYSAAAFNRAYFGCIAGFDVTAKLGDIQSPTLIVSGTHDFFGPLKETGERLQDGISGSLLVVHQGSGHFPFIENQARFNEDLAGWARAL